MITDDKTGLEIPESEEEQLWISARVKCRDVIGRIPELIKDLENEEKLNRAIMEMIEKKLLDLKS